MIHVTSDVIINSKPIQHIPFRTFVKKNWKWAFVMSVLIAAPAMAIGRQLVLSQLSSLLSPRLNAVLLGSEAGKLVVEEGFVSSESERYAAALPENVAFLKEYVESISGTANKSMIQRLLISAYVKPEINRLIRDLEEGKNTDSKTYKTAAQKLLEIFHLTNSKTQSSKTTVVYSEQLNLRLKGRIVVSRNTFSMRVQEFKREFELWEAEGHPKTSRVRIVRHCQAGCESSRTFFFTNCLGAYGGLSSVVDLTAAIGEQRELTELTERLGVLLKAEPEGSVILMYAKSNRDRLRCLQELNEQSVPGVERVLAESLVAIK